MSDIIPNVVVSMPSQLFTLARKFQAASNGKIFIGKIDTDPTLPENQVQVYLENEDGPHIPVPQPLIINQAGFPVYNGQIAKFVTVEGHSMAVYDSYGAQQHYYPNVLKYDPDQFEKRFESEFPQRIKDIFGVVTVTFKNVAELQASNLNVGDIARTLGLRNPNDGGGTVYRVISSQGTRPEGKGYKVTEYPFEYGDVRIANGNIAKRVTSVKKPDKVKFWAHRGGQREFAENTMFAFSQAIDNGAYGVELDLSMSSDGIWHVYHDASLYILTNGTDYIYNRDSEYLRGLTFNKLKNTKYADLIKIPTFSEFLSWAKENNIQFSAEFKNPRPGMVDEDIRAGIQMIVDSGCELQSIVQVTTNVEAMRVREVSNNIIISWSVTNLDTSSIELYKDYNGLYMQTFSKNLNSNSSNAIKLIHALGYEVVVYTDGNKQDDIINSIAYGVDHIISDRGFEVNKS
ncbi:TPA: hypothetical protein SLO96_000891 [Proteus mirabilis]|nr:hypothetical protein [Proteus mirabilis]HEJ0214536.1 hypothetical protein [Proteus mirabilis]HEJ1045859.1 hypothetical protein [Proteus mirabilis]